MGRRDYICEWFCFRLLRIADNVVIHHIHGCVEVESESKRPITSFPDGSDEWIFEIQGEPGMGRPREDTALVSRDAIGVECD
jgi:hypothetical protein